MKPIKKRTCTEGLPQWGRASAGALATLSIVLTAALCSGGVLRRTFAQSEPPTASESGAAAAAASPQAPVQHPAEARQVQIDGVSAGEVDLFGKPAIRIRSGSGSPSSIQRAQVVADRLNTLYNRQELSDVRVGQINGQVVVMTGNGEEIITASPERSEEHKSELQSRPHLVCR